MAGNTKSTDLLLDFSCHLHSMAYTVRYVYSPFMRRFVYIVQTMPLKMNHIFLYKCINYGTLLIYFCHF